MQIKILTNTNQNIDKWNSKFRQIQSDISIGGLTKKDKYITKFIQIQPDISIDMSTLKSYNVKPVAGALLLTVAEYIWRIPKNCVQKNKPKWKLEWNWQQIPNNIWHFIHI